MKLLTLTFLMSSSLFAFEYKESRHPHKIMDFQFVEKKEVTFQHKMEYQEEFSPYVSTFYYKERERIPSSPEGFKFNYGELEEFSPSNAFNF